MSFISPIGSTFNKSGHFSLSVRFSEAADFPRILHFYQANRHDHVDVRESAQLEKAARDGRNLLFLNPAQEIVAASSAYDYTDDPSQPGKWVEIGSTRCTLQGFGLYPFIIASQVVHESGTRPPGEMFFASVYTDNAAVCDLLERKTGWKPMIPPQSLVEVTGLEADMPKLAWFKSDKDCLPAQEKIVRDVHENPVFTNRKTGEIITLDLSRCALASVITESCLRGCLHDTPRASHCPAPQPLCPKEP
jgi:hypothetical protein